MAVKHYRVVWQMDFDVESPEEAAREALAVMRDPESTATIVEVEEYMEPAMERAADALDLCTSYDAATGKPWGNDD